MRDTKLICVEGVPGTGKSTTSRYIDTLLQGWGVPRNLWEEHQEGHPLNVGGELHPSGNRTGQEFFSLYDPQLFIEDSIQRLESFVRSLSGSETVLILDSYPYQNSVRLLMQLDASPSLIETYAVQVERLLSPLEPTMIYLRCSDPRKLLRAMGERRGAVWAAYAVDLALNCPYASARGLSGVAGAEQVIMDYAICAESLLQSSQMDVLVLDNCHANWEACYEQIASFVAPRVAWTHL